jgi:hypothetical protein
LVKPVADSWEKMFGVPLPFWSLLPWLLNAVIALVAILLSYAVGFVTAKGVAHFSSHPVDLQRWGAIASILGLLLSLLLLIVS